MLKPAPLTCFLTIMFFLSPDAHTKPLLINQCRFIPPVIFPPKEGILPEILPCRRISFLQSHTLKGSNCSSAFLSDAKKPWAPIVNQVWPIFPHQPVIGHLMIIQQRLKDGKKYISDQSTVGDQDMCPCLFFTIKEVILCSLYIVNNPM